MDNKQKLLKKSFMDYVFCLVVGGVYLYAITRTIVSATFIYIEPLTLYLIGLLGIVCFLFILYNKFTRIITAVFVFLVAVVFFLTLDDFQEQYTHLYEVYLMVTGRLPYRTHLGRTVVWIISFLLSFAVVVFMFHQFSFIVLALGGAAVFIFTWIPGFTQYETSFLFFIVAFCLILLRKTNKSVAVVLAAAPLCVAVVWLASVYIPDESAFFKQRHFAQASNGFRTAVEDFFHELFNPPHFTFQSTGFSGAGGRLGGPITLNDRYVMTVHAPGRTYLAGATSNTYTGFRWIQTLEDGMINTHGLSPARFEMLETTAALIRYATHKSSYSSLALFEIGLEPAELQRLHAQQFYTIGVNERTYRQIGLPVFGVDEHEFIFPDVNDLQALSEFEGFFTTLEPGLGLMPQPANVEFRPVFVNVRESGRFYWHTYMPFEIMTIVQGVNRTSTVFTPPRMTELWFDESSFDYAPYVEVTPTGDKQTPSFMSRGAAYHMQFLNVDTRLSFVDNILRLTTAGIYELHGKVPWLIMPSFAMQINIPPWSEVIWGNIPDAQIIELPEAPLDVAGFAALLEYFTYPAATEPAGGRRHSPQAVHYISDTALFMGLLNSFSANILAEYAREVRQHFLGVPELVPQRVHELTMEIIEGQTSDFGRVMAIRNYLLQFPYTLDPVPVPRGVCFVDHFLFEGREGYCTYFASAMAVMSRIAGVPSRYVEGFVLPPTGTPDETVTVTNRMAHAWAEVYLEGFGWHIMEATPTYAFLMNPYVPLPQGGGITGDWTDNELLARIQGLMDDFEIPETDRPSFHGERPPVTSPEAEPEIEEAFDTRWFVLALALLVVLNIAAFFAVQRWQIKYRLWRIKKLSPNQQAKSYFHGIMDIIACYTSPLTPEETPKSYGIRMGKRFAFRSDSVFFRDLITLYYKAKYSSGELSQAEVELMKEAYHDMVNLLRNMRHRLIFIYLRYVRGVGRI